MALMDKKITLQFKGARNYLHGTDLFNAIIEEYGASNICDLRFSVHEFILVPECILYAADTQAELNALRDTHVRCQFMANGVARWLAVVPVADSSVAVGGRYEYNEQDVISLCTLNNESITLTGTSPFSFIETVVAMNKQLHQSLFADAVGKWIFTRIDLNARCDARENITLSLRHNMNYRLTKSDILLAGAKIGDIYFSLVKS